MGDKILQTRQTFENLLTDVVCDNFEFIIREHKGSLSLQIQFEAEDNVSPGTSERQYCRLWPLQNTMCDSEVIRTAYKAAEAAMLHEFNELFRFKGEMIYSPHMNVHQLVELRQKGAIANQVRIQEEDLFDNI